MLLLSVLEITQTEPWESIQDKRELVVLWVERFKGKHQKSGVYTSQPECTETGTIMWTLLSCELTQSASPWIPHYYSA